MEFSSIRVCLHCSCSVNAPDNVVSVRTARLLTIVTWRPFCNYSHQEKVLEPPPTPRDRRSCRLGDGDSGCYAASSGCRRPPFGGCRVDPATAAGREEHHGKWSPDGPRLTSERRGERKERNRIGTVTLLLFTTST